MKPNDRNGQNFFQEAELRVEKLVSNGQGLARWNGEAILIAGALAGEKLKVSVGAPVRGVRRGRILEVLEGSPWRIQPDCPLAGPFHFIYILLFVKKELSCPEGTALYKCLYIFSTQFKNRFIFHTIAVVLF